MLLSLARFWINCKAGVAPMLALGIIPLIGAIGAAVDYGHASSVKAAMQYAIDATALMLAKNANAEQCPASNLRELDFPGQFQPSRRAKCPGWRHLHFGTGGFNVAINGTATVNTNFMGMIGYSQIPISTTATVNWNNAKLRVVSWPRFLWTPHCPREPRRNGPHERQSS